LSYIKYGPFILATVRPETKFGDTAVAVHPEDKRYKKWIGKEIEVEGLLGKFKLRVIADEFVDPEFGTGVVKVTPGHDPNDFEMSKRHNLETKQVIDLRGKLTEIAGPYAGMNVRMAREKVAEDLEKKGLIEKIDKNYLHAVTVCYKCKRDLEPMIVPNWFIRVKTLKEPVKKVVKEDKVKFYPARFKKQMLNWLEIMHDWPISRQIAWGIRIPAWYDLGKNPNLEIVFLDKENGVVSGKAYDLLKKYNFEEIEARLQSLIAPNDAKYVISNKKPAGNFLQETDTFDTWFSSGQWPLVTLKKNEYKDRFPTDTLGTLHEILKFWVSRMIMFSLYSRGEIPFKDVYLWSMVTDKKGVKMSKSKGNVVNPIELADKYGADAFRMGLLYGTAQGSRIPLSEEKVKGMRNFANKIWNAARFIEMMEDGSSGEDKNNQDFELRIKKIVIDTDRDLGKYQFGRVTERLYEEF
jgi:valyl-tRNA synthetase